MRTKEQILEFIRKQKTAFIASVDEDGKKYPLGTLRIHTTLGSELHSEGYEI